jgi:hypothetical protein
MARPRPGCCPFRDGQAPRQISGAWTPSIKSSDGTQAHAGLFLASRARDRLRASVGKTLGTVPKGSTQRVAWFKALAANQRRFAVVNRASPHGLEWNHTGGHMLPHMTCNPKLSPSSNPGQAQPLPAPLMLIIPEVGRRLDARLRQPCGTISQPRHSSRAVLHREFTHPRG